MNCGGHALLYLPSSNHISGIFSSSEICLFLPLFCLHDEKFCVMNNMTRNPGHNWSVQKLVPYSSWANWKGPQGMWTLRCHLVLAVLLNWVMQPTGYFLPPFFFSFCFPGSGIDAIGLRQERREKHTWSEIQRGWDVVSVVAEVLDSILRFCEILYSNILIISFLFSFESVQFGFLLLVTK